MKSSQLRFIQKYTHKTDFPSLKESLEYHTRLINNSKLKKKAKYFKTSDQKSIDIANDILKKRNLPIDILANPGSSINQNESI